MATLTATETIAFQASVRETPAQMARWCLDFRFVALGR